MSRGVRIVNGGGVRGVSARAEAGGAQAVVGAASGAESARLDRKMLLLGSEAERGNGLWG